MRHFGLIGYPLVHSFSAGYFNEKFRRERIDAEYSLLEIASIEELGNQVRNLTGFNVTIPYKKAVIPYLAQIADEARAVGAVNCVKVDSEGKLHGYNTDVEGIRATLAQCGDLSGVKALVLGSGGAAAAVRFVLKEADIDFMTVSRSGDRGNCTYSDLTGEIIREHRLIINTTPLGMYPETDAMPDIPYSALTDGHILFDLIYNPEQTRFLQEGAARGARTFNGREMFVRQAEASWRIWNQ